MSGGPSNGHRFRLLQLLPDYLRNPEAFARPGPPSAPPLPLKFTCRGCGSTVDPENGVCHGCAAVYDF